MRMRDEKGIDDKIVAVSVRDPAYGLPRQGGAARPRAAPGAPLLRGTAYQGSIVTRTIAAPEQVMRAMVRTGFEGLCHALSSPGSMGRPLARWQPAELLAGGLPVFPRLSIGSPRDDLVLRSFLGQPLIVYLHNEDLVDGLGALVETAAFINREPAVRWGMPRASRARATSRREGTVLHVRPLRAAWTTTRTSSMSSSSCREAMTSRTASGRRSPSKARALHRPCCRRAIGAFVTSPGTATNLSTAD